MGSKRLFVILVLILASCNQSSAQSKQFLVHIVDNASIYNNRLEYRITDDSLVITGLGDYGRSPVKYHQRKLTKKESKSLSGFLKSFPLDSLDDLYNNNFNPVDYDEKNYYPRIMELTISYGNRSHYYKTVNCWVRYSEQLFKAINPLIPQEVRIKYDKAQFNAFY